MLQRWYHTAESVTAGHPDKVADQVSDAVLDACLTIDPKARVACETFLANGLVVVGGQITVEGAVDVERAVRKTIADIGYNTTRWNFDGEHCAVMLALERQSPDIAAGVGSIDDPSLGAGDQGIMYGFACRETPELMPLPISLAHGLARRLADVRSKHDGIGPDGKTQVTVEYDGFRPVRITKVVVSSQHAHELSLDELRVVLKNEIIDRVLPQELVNDETEYLINPAGAWHLGGPKADTGLTGRKIIVDTYGGYAHHGGGCFSGKDATKVDRTGAYAARWLARNIVSSALAERAEVQVAYAIGKPEPVSVSVNTFGTGQIPDHEIAQRIVASCDLRPYALIRRFDLLSPRFTPLAAYGHFGRVELNVPWEQDTLVLL